MNAHALARYAALCQEAGIVPIVEPEVLMDGEHTIERVVRSRPTRVLEAMFHTLVHQHVEFEGMLLKPNMVLPGYDCPEQVSDEEIAEATVRCFRWTVPAAVPGIVFLSGGQSDEQATARLERDEPARAAPVAAELLVRACAPGAGAEGVEGRCRQPRRGHGGVPAPGAHEQRGPQRLVHQPTWSPSAPEPALINVGTTCGRHLCESQVRHG